jgi:hypothetical protein
MLLRIESLAPGDREKPGVISMKNFIKFVMSGGLV